ncbi:glutathione transferase omega class [Trametes sanguinea]|nr:glutathione transferase omega class [Trametes sanguinea]
MPERIVLYTAKICPYAQRVEIALAEAKAPHVQYQIDLQNKPEWYAPKVNPASKVPAIAYGGPDVPPDQPSPESVKLAESLILVEFVADLYPNSGILPADPVLRAKARFFVDGVSTKFVPAWQAYLQGKGPVEDFYKAVEYLQGLLPEQGYAIGEYSLADIALTPFLARARVALLNDFGGYPQGEGPKVIEALTPGSGRFARIGKYFNDLLARESFKATFDEGYITERYKARFADLRK